MFIEKPKIENLSIAISTCNERVIQAVQLAEKISDIGQVIIIHQVDDCFVHPSLPENVRYLRLHGKGVAKSRNAALKYIKSGYIWFLDDDVTVDVDVAKVRLPQLLSKHAEIDVLTIGVLNEDGGPRKKYPAKASQHNLISILSVGTIEIIVKRSSLNDDICSFPEDMGAGSELPVGDEPVFLSRCLKAGLIVYFYPEYFVGHPSESSGSGFEKYVNSYSRGVTFRRIFGFTLGSLLLTSMYFKKAIFGEISFSIFVFSYIHALRGVCCGR